MAQSKGFDNVADYLEKLKQKKEKEGLFKSIVKSEFQAKYFRRIYSFYRIATAVIESYCVITILVLILIVSGRGWASILAELVRLAPLLTLRAWV